MSLKNGLVVGKREHLHLFYVLYGKQIQWSTAMPCILYFSLQRKLRYFGIHVIVQDNMSIKLFEGVIPSPQNTSSQNCALPQTVVADEPPPPPPPPSRLPRLLPPENPAAAAPPPPVATKTASNR